jgi:hypothetical protein
VPFLTATTDVTNGQILIVVALLVVPIAAIAFATVGSSLKTLGKGRFAIEQEMPRSRGLRNSAAPINSREQEAEVRQMLEAKSYRRQQRGEAALDIDAETKRLLNPPAPAVTGIDAELREEVRQLVVARNERRMRQGKAPLDVGEEIDRQLRDLENLGQ